MANTFTKQLANLILQPANIVSLRDAIIVKLINDEDIRQVLTIQKVRQGDPIATIGEMNAVGHAGGGCNPTYKEIGVANTLKRWNLGSWEIAIKICYQSFEGTMAELALKTGKDIADLTGTEILALYTDLLATQMKRMFWRMAWFGDKTAKTVANGGIITDTEDITLINMADGLFKNLFALPADQVTNIAANAEETTAKQITKMRTQGEAVKVVESILLDAPTLVNQNGNAVLMLNGKFADILAFDIMHTYNESLKWETIFDGFQVANYFGTKIAAVRTWDYMINTYNAGTGVIEKPFRAVYTDPRNLLVGVDDTNAIDDFDVWFNRDERVNKIYSTGKIDTAIAEPKRVHLAY